MSPAIQSATSGLTLVPLSPAETDTPSPGPVTQPKERHLTVTPRTLPRGRGYVNIPQIILGGLYLEKIGFTIGSKVAVSEKPGEIIIRLDGPSAEHDPNETPDDRRLARKVNKVNDYQQRAGQPLSMAVIASYLSGKMPFNMQELLYKLINRELSEPYQTNVYQFLHSKKKPAIQEMECDSILREINNLPKPRRKPAARKTSPSGTSIKPIPTNATRQIPKAAAPGKSESKKATPSLPAWPASPAPADLQAAQPPAVLQVAEPQANPRSREYPQIDGLDPGRSYIRNVLRTMKCPPPPAPAAGPTLREQLESIGPRIKPSYDCLEIPARLGEYFTADELEIHDSCRPEHGSEKAAAG